MLGVSRSWRTETLCAQSNPNRGLKVGETLIVLERVFGIEVAISSPSKKRLAQIKMNSCLDSKGSTRQIPTTKRSADRC